MTEHTSSSTSSKNPHLDDEDDEETSSQRLARHLSKSTSELNGRECSIDSPNTSPQRTKSAANPSVSGVLQKTHGFFNTLKHRWNRAKSKERLGRKSPNDFLEQESTDYAADYSSEGSSATHSPRHRATTISGSPLARLTKMTAFHHAGARNGNSFNEGDLGYDDENGHKIDRSTMELLQADEERRKKETQLRQYVFFQLRVHLKSGHNLIAMDKNGLSDPYVKFKISGRLLHKSRTIHRDLNPNWDEVFVVPIEDPFLPINIKVFDYDWGLQDDFMGAAKLDLTKLELGKAEDISLKLSDNSHPERDFGEIIMNVTLWPRSQEDKEVVSFIQRIFVQLLIVTVD